MRVQECAQGRTGRRRRLAAAVAVSLLAAHASAQDLARPADPPTVDAVAYAPQLRILPGEPPAVDAEEVTVPSEEEIREIVGQSSALMRLAGQPPASASGLVLRAEADLVSIYRAVASLGFWGALVEIRIAGTRVRDDGIRDAALESAMLAEPVPVEITVTPGQLYTVDKASLVDASTGALLTDPAVDRTALPAQPGVVATGRAVAETETAVVNRFRAAGHPFAAIPDRRIVVDHATRTMEASFSVSPGPTATLGPVDVAGNERVETDFILSRAPFAGAEPYSPEAIAKYRDELASLDLFRSIRIREAATLDPDGSLPITVEVEEKPRRFVGFGALYSSTEGLSIDAFWGHRNLFGRAERIEVTAKVGRLLENSYDDLEYALETTFRKPGVWTPKDDFNARLGAFLDDTDAYEREAIEAAASIEREIDEGLRVGFGLEFEQSQVTDFTGENDYTLVGIPLFVDWDTTDDLLDPTEGWRLRVDATPFSSIIGSNVDMAILRATGTSYWDAFDNSRLVVAGRLSLGSILGADVEDVPANRRFYAGGGGSVRGYAFQSIGPRDPNDEPTGGLSLIEASFEARYKVTETIGIVPFIDAGGVFEEGWFDFGEDVLVGAGLGVRYYSPIGPIRIDVAMPLDKRSDDDSFQFYVSIGQAF